MVSVKLPRVLLRHPYMRHATTYSQTGAVWASTFLCRKNTRSLGQKFECSDFERVFCQTRQILAGINALFQGSLTKYGEKLAKRRVLGTFDPST